MNFLKHMTYLMLNSLVCNSIDSFLNGYTLVILDINNRLSGAGCLKLNAGSL